jgi:hypothetical protein
MKLLLAKYEDRDKRTKSFDLCQHLKPLQIKYLIDQGFLYISSDLCVCYSCCTNIDISIDENFDDFDSPTIESLHAIANPFCSHLYMYKGSDFILEETSDGPFAVLVTECMNPTPGDMRNASERIRSFSVCPADCNRLLLREIVENGFYYCVHSKKYVCYNCHTTFNFSCMAQFNKVIDLQRAHASRNYMCRIGYFYLGSSVVKEKITKLFDRIYNNAMSMIKGKKCKP